MIIVLLIISTHLSDVTAVSISGEFQNTSYFCNGEIYPPDQSTCYHISAQPTTWQDAFDYCHKRGGWLMNGLDDIPSLIDVRVLVENKLLTVWSGTYVDEYRLLADNFTAPYSGFMEDNSWLQNSTYDGDCVSLVYTCNPNILGEIGCTATYLSRFTACTESLNFVCIFRGILGDFPVYPTAKQGVVVLSNDYILTEFYISNKVSNVNGSDDTCLAKLLGGKTFSLSTSGQIALLNKYVGTPAFSDYTEQQVSFSGDLESLLFWVDGLKDKCVAARFVDKQGAYTVTFTSWPCDQDLLVLCQVAKILPETPVPRLKFDSPLSNIIKVDNEIQMPSSYYLNINPVRQTTPAARLYCVTAPLQPPFQTVVIYANQIPVQTSSGVNQTLHEIQLYRNNGDVYPTDQGNIYYRCEINDANDNRVLKSNSVFIRLIDQEIYAVHIPLNKTYDYTTRVAWMLHKATLTDNWFTSDAYYGFNENVRLNLNEITTNLQRITTATGFTPVPKLFIADMENPTFIFYVKRTIPNNFTINNLSKANYDKAVNALESSIKMFKGNLSYFDVGSVQVFSIDWCWNTSIQADAVGLNVTLPRSRIGTVWSSAQLCAQDGQPILTVRCNGNKKVGLSWSKIRVNPLCDYSRFFQNKTNITHILETVSQQNITSINVTTIIDAVKNLTSVLKNGTTTSIDIVYLADIIQKSTQVANLSSDTVQGIMDTVSNLKRFSRNLLQESNQIGNATNRLLKSMDHLGKQIASQTEGGLHHQRLISGGLGLDVWDFTNAKNLTTIIGLKVLSGGETAVLTAGELISLFTKENLHYNAAEVAIILPREFIEQFQANGSSLRLSMNVYKDTTLFTSIQDNNNRTLNSKVIAAQILLDSQQISDLSPYNVTTVFLPSQQLPPKARTNLTTCVYWSFTENSGAGGWSNDGCMYQQTIEGRDICVCDHLTNFAVLMSFYDQESMDQENQLALSIISIIGLSFSIIGLSLSILSFLLIKALRQSRPQQTMFNLSLALLMAWIVFLAGINQTSSHAGCIVVAVLLHYLILASFMWMLMEGILQYLLFVKVMNIYFHRYLLKTALPAWGLPVVPVIIILIIDKELYKGGNEYCWMSLPALYYGFAIPIGIIILTNIVFFIMVTVSLCRRRDMSKHSTSKRNQTVVNVRASFICFCVLGLSWIFGFLAIADARVAFQYLFCIFNTLQGFIMFIMMTARDSNVRKYWLSKFYKHRKKEKERKTGKSNSENTNFYPKAAATNNTVSSNSNSKSTTTTIFDGIDKH